MRLRRIVWLACALALGAAPARAALPECSLLGLPVAPRGADGGWLAQRTIDREWGPSDDSTYREVDVPGWKSEGLAMVLSGAVPGAGHLYLGENSGWLYALGEVALWVGHGYEVRAARREWSNLVAFMGNPYDSSSTFSFARYQRVTGRDPSDLEALYWGDRAAFYRTLDGDPAYLGGFISTNAGGSQDDMHSYLAARDDAMRRQWLFDAAVWVNHVLAGLDALRSARLHNAPLREGYHLELGYRGRHGERELRAALVRRF